MTQHRIKRSSLKPNKPNCVRLSAQTFVVVFDDGTNIKVFSEVCPHMGGPLAQGKYCKKSNSISCPWHGYNFSSTQGYLKENPNRKMWIEALAENPASYETPNLQLKAFPFSIDGEEILIDL